MMVIPDSIPAPSEEENVVDSEDDAGSGWLWATGKWTFVFLLLFLAVFSLLKVVILWRSRRLLRRWELSSPSYRPVIVGFFHPYCGAAGGGERVLWQSIHALQKRYSFVRCVVYTGDRDMKPQAILNKVQERFKIVLHGDVHFVYLKRRGWVEAKRWPRFTILGQSLGSLVLGMEALLQLAPHVYIDTTGYAFTLPLFRWLGGCKIACYVHYPTVSSDMLHAVGSQAPSYNNSSVVSRSRALTRIKMWYYRLFACLYGFVGRRSDVVMVNSSWTHCHIRSIWNPSRLFIVYPPCDTSSFERLPLKRDTQTFRIISVSQFRPEKNHRGQLRILRELVKGARLRQVRLVLVGSCRNAEDEGRVDDLRHLAEELHVSDNVEFKVNIGFDQLQRELGKAAAAIHTMENEHFGISIVECMAAGCVMVAHASGGPREDIVVEWQQQQTGYVAETEEQFVSWLIEVVNMRAADREALAATAREAVRTKFSLDVFEASFLRATEKLFG